MTALISDAVVEPVIGTLMGAATSSGGPTREQYSVIVTLAVACWGRDENQVDELALTPAEAARQVVHESDRRRLKELLVLLELCGHPLTDERVTVTERYAEELREAGPSLTVVRNLVQLSAERTFEDYMRLYDGLSAGPPTAGHQMSPKFTTLHNVLESYGELPEGSLGRAYFDFHARNGFALPEVDSPNAQTFLHHDSAHVVAGYEPTGEGEIALGGMQLAAADTEKNWLSFMGNLLIHEVGHVVPGYEHARTQVLHNDRGRSMLAEAFERGSASGQDFSNIDLLTLASTDIQEVRALYSIPPPG